MNARSADEPGERIRVLHTLAVSVPHLNGYAVRSRYLVATQQRMGRFRPTVITSPFYAGNPASWRQGAWDGVRHHRVPHPTDSPADDLGDRLAATLYRARRTRLFAAARSAAERLGRPGGGSAAGVDLGSERGGGGRRPRGRGASAGRLAAAADSLEERLLMRRFERHIRALARAEGSAVIHAHSPYRTALPAIAAARALGLPCVYELRGVWEDSAVASGRFEMGGAAYRAWRRKETRALLSADAVVCICEALRQEVLHRGVDPSRVFVVPNAVDSERFAPPDPATAPGEVESLRRSLRGTVFGYVGSVRALEGVDELARAVAELVRRGHDVSLLVVGGGEVEELRRLTRQLELGPRAQVIGAVPHEVVAHYYGLIDGFVVSRPDIRVARLVTPLKPLEAMALGRPLIVSDLPALREIVRPGETGLVYQPGDPADLADRCEELIADPARRTRLAEAARRWVVRERSWEAAIAPLATVYETACQAAASRARGTEAPPDPR